MTAAAAAVVALLSMTIVLLLPSVAFPVSEILVSNVPVIWLAWLTVFGIT